MIELRKSLPALAGIALDVADSKNPHILSYVRHREGNRLLVLANFSDTEQAVDGNIVRTSGLGRFFKDCISGTSYKTAEPVRLEAYQVLWLERE